MFWKILTGFARAAITINKSVTAIGAAVVITVGVYDYLKHRKERENHNRRIRCAATY